MTQLALDGLTAEQQTDHVSAPPAHGREHMPMDFDVGGLPGLISDR
ncbi:hypothetical protein ODJ79_39555 [Actinoplanes sp. KI2]|nr:hypothetical protein [Actinoplanes sp. KI2]MCU7729849.1 hypothetical protein [Actinoplanes sp. KI2]